jgi:hypothetical protein
VEYKQPIQVADPQVSKRKFEEQISKFKNVEVNYRERGILCSKLSYPDAYFIFAIPKLNPYPIAFAVRINFSNYDVEPPSVSFINPFTEQLLKREQIPIMFIQLNQTNPLQPQDLLQGMGEIAPFFCIPGIKEYHDHPAHSGDSWFLYRTRGEGELLFILDQLYNHSIPMSKGFQVNVLAQIMRIQQELKISNVMLNPIVNPNIK